MRNKFNYSAVHKNVMRDRANRSVTEQGAKGLRSALDDALKRQAHKEEVTGGKQHEK